MQNMSKVEGFPTMKRISQGEKERSKDTLYKPFTLSLASHKVSSSRRKKLHLHTYRHIHKLPHQVAINEITSFFISPQGRARQTYARTRIGKNTTHIATLFHPFSSLSRLV
jgi:hypothetical protein